jgi:TolA-binding protein
LPAANADRRDRHLGDEGTGTRASLSGVSAPSMRALILPLALAIAASVAAGPAEAQDAPAPVPVAAPPPERLVGQVPDAVTDFRAAQARFEARGLELLDDTTGFVGRARTEKLDRVRKAFDPMLADLDSEHASQAAVATAAFEDFLDRYDDVAYADDVRLRLAELYFQAAEAEWLAASERYYTALDEAGDDLDLLLELEEKGAPKLELSRVIALLERTVEANRDRPPEARFELLDFAYYMLGFCYEKPNGAQLDRDKAKAVFRELTQATPDSEYADAAHLLIGLFLFDEVRFNDSMSEFQSVIDRGPSGPYYDAALYQLAWAHYKLSDYDRAMTLFVEILDLSERLEADTGKASNYADDARIYLGLSLLDQADGLDAVPLDHARAFFARLGSRPYAWDVYVALAENLSRYARGTEAVDVYRYLQADPAHQLRPENPDFQWKIIDELSRGFGAALAAAGEARLQMTERYGQGTPWWNANIDNPEALAAARRYIEQLLVEVAIEVKVRAQEADDKAIYLDAAAKYREYLDRFPIAEDYYEHQFQMADALYKADAFEAAEVEFGKLVKSGKSHDYGDLSLVMRMRSWEQLLYRDVGKPSEPWAAAVVERTYETPTGKSVDVKALAPAQAAFIAASDAVLAHAFRDEPTLGNDVKAFVRAERPKIMYLPAQILFYASRYAEARPRLLKLIEEHPSTDEAAYAANLVLNTYINEGDSEGVRKYTRQFASMRLGATTSLIEQKSREFSDLLEQSTYNIAYEASQAGDFEAAAEAYLAFIEEFPKSKFLSNALISAAFNYQRMGRSVEANELYERFVREYPADPESRKLYFGIASNYEATFQLDKAIFFYNELVTRFPTDSAAPDAQFMIGFLKEGMGDPLGAAAAYEKYGEKYPDRPDVEDVVWRAGRQYELAGEERAIRFYRSYLDRFGLRNPNHALEAQQRIADLYVKLGKTRDAGKALDDVMALFDRAVAEGATIGPAGRDAAAAAAFRALEAQAQELLGRALSGNEKKDADLLNQFSADIPAYDEAASAFIGKYVSVEYTLAAGYYAGAVRRRLASLGLSLKPPGNLSDEDTDAYWELLEERIFPVYYQLEDVAIQNFKAVLKQARDLRRHYAWVDLAQTALNEMRPSEYPAVKQPVSVVPAAVEPPRIAPILPGDRFGKTPAPEEVP